MFDWLTRRGPEARGLEQITRNFAEMLEDGRHVFDAAANALLGGTDVEVIRDDLFRTDQRINETEQKIRRQLVVHGSIHGAQTFPALLVMMSLVKDAERVGDYAKNIYDLAKNKSDLGDEASRAELVSLKDEISRLLVRAKNLYEGDQRLVDSLESLRGTPLDLINYEMDNLHRLDIVLDPQAPSVFLFEPLL